MTAQCDRSPKGQDAARRLDAQRKSAVAEGDAPNLNGAP